MHRYAFAGLCASKGIDIKMPTSAVDLYISPTARVLSA